MSMLRRTRWIAWPSAGAVLDHVDVLHDVLDTDGAHM